MKLALYSKAFLRLSQLKREEAARVKADRTHMIRVRHPYRNKAVSPNAAAERKARQEAAERYFRMSKVPYMEPEKHDHNQNLEAPARDVPSSDPAYRLPR